ncbi:hypothetical protein E0Z10_g7871 [Xylaria hypoxylon]|uniref:Uncharacterized protein n=1 Tax=Xylaria hypoxylon TaxID=37992 RepID=A0A4Z0YL96_9PEZI|nr:hypothetical protein E0Z10_g7871 [Xylaria hypoxylon]
MMSSFRGLCLLRATQTRPSHIPSSLHLRPSSITSRISPSPLHHIQQHGRRSFHWQSAASTTIEGAQNLIVDLHTVTSLPWFLTIPLVAFTVGAVFRLPFSIYTQRILQRRTNFGPLLQAWNARIQQDVQQEGISASSRMSEVKARQDKALKRIYRKLGLQEWRMWGSILSFPIWLVAIDAVRRLCGGPRGLIGSLFIGPGSSSETTVAAHVEAASSLPPGSVADPSTLDPVAISSAVETAHMATVDPSLTLEGCLWFTDLTASDPYHMLPIALSVTLVLNMLPKSGEKFSDRVRIALGRRPKSARAQTFAGDEKVGFRERLFATFYLCMVGVATLVGPLTLDLPAALHLYWLASSMSNVLFMKGLRHLMPVEGRLLKRCTGAEFPVIRPQRQQKN